MSAPCIVYDANGATSGTVPKCYQTYDSAIPLARVVGNIGHLAKTDFEWAGWNTRQDLSGETFYWNDLYEVPAAESTLYAKWIRPFQDSSFAAGLPAGFDCSFCARRSDGRIFVAGVDWKAGSSIVYRLMADGSLDATFTPPVIGDEDVLSDCGIGEFAFFPDGSAALLFGQYQGTGLKNGLMRLNADGAVDGSFSPSTLADAAIQHIQAQGEKLIIAGKFRNYGGTPAKHLARIDLSGTLDPTFAPGTSLNYPPYEALALSSGKILLTGPFTSFNGTACKGVIRLTADGALDPGFSIGADPVIAPSPYSSSTLDILIDAVEMPDGRLFVYGGFSAIGGVATGPVAILGADGAVDASFAIRTPFDNEFNAYSFDNETESRTGLRYSANVRFFISPAGQIYFTARRLYFEPIDSGVYRIKPDGYLDAAFDLGEGPSDIDDERRIVFGDDGRIIVFGTFDAFSSRVVPGMIGVRP